jgi:hypothetical protein
MTAVRFDREEKAWMTISGGGDDETVEWPEPIYELRRFRERKRPAGKRADAQSGRSGKLAR